MRIQTVLGEIDSDALGRTLFHEHLIIKYPGAEFDPKSDFDRDAAIAEGARRLTELREVHGVETFVDPCPIELGRDVEAMARISEKSGVNVICTTGFYHETLGLPPYWKNSSVDQIAELYITELRRGVLKTGIRAGALKCATGAPSVASSEEKMLKAACIAQKETGVAIITHTTSGVLGPEQQAIFTEHGIPLHRVVIGHCCENPDPSYHRGMLERGSYVGFDRIGWAQFQSDDVRADTLAQLIRDGYSAQIMLGHDRFVAMIGRHGREVTPEESRKMEQDRKAGRWPPPFTHLFDSFFPKLVARQIPMATLYAMLDENPKRFFGGAPIPPRAKH